jgi:hypothetical protein
MALRAAAAVRGWALPRQCAEGTFWVGGLDRRWRSELNSGIAESRFCGGKRGGEDNSLAEASEVERITVLMPG